MALRPRDWTVLLLVVPLALAVAAYARVLPAEFVFDDFTSVVQNRALRDLGALVAGAWGSFWSGGRPVTELTFALNLRLGGLEPWGFHAVNLGLHLATTALVWLLARAVLLLAGAARWRGQALAAAGLWAVHPLGSQAVSYVSQRAEVLASLLMVAALLALLAAERAGRTWRGAAWLGGGLVAFGAALGSKPMAVTVPALAALLSWGAPGPERRPALPGWRARAVLLAAPLALALAYAMGTLRGLRTAESAGFDLPGLDPASYLLTQFRAVATYLRLVFWPTGQSVDWDVTPSRSLAEPAALASGLLLLGLAAGAVTLLVAGRRREGEGAAAARVVGLGVLWFLVVLAPTSSVVPVADLLVEHRAYLASWGVVLAVVAAGERVASRVPWAHAGRALAVLVGAAWLALAGALHARNAVWESALALWTDATAGGRGPAGAYLGLGSALVARGDAAGGLAAFEAAFQRARGRPLEEAEALQHAGAVLLAAGRLEPAERALRAAAERAPRWSTMSYTLAQVLWQRGDLAGAEDSARRCLELQPDRADATHLLGAVTLQAGRAEEATTLLEKAARLAPWVAAIRVDLGLAHQRAGRLAEACATWRAALRLPAEEAVHRRLVDSLASAGCPPG